MKRSPLKRKAPLKSGSSLKGGGQLKRTPIANRSKARQAHMKTQRAPAVKAMVESGVKCEIRPVLEQLGITTQCMGEISGLHERRKSSTGGSRVNPDNLIPACSWCNGFLEDAVGEDREKIESSRLVVRLETDPEWEALGKRADKLLT